MLRHVVLILLLAFLALPGCIGVSGDVTPQGQDQSRVVLAVPLDRPYSYRQQDGDKRLTAQGFLRGQVVSVHDGNTLTVLIEGRTEKIRLIGVDRPEVAHSQWGEQARETLKALVEGKTIRLETDITLRDQDKRLLAYVYTAELLVNAEMIRQGQACIHTVPPNVAHVEEYRKAQAEAREARRGMWHPQQQLNVIPDCISS